jgi:hypothetical protein
MHAVRACVCECVCVFVCVRESVCVSMAAFVHAVCACAGGAGCCMAWMQLPLTTKPPADMIGRNRRLE